MEQSCKFEMKWKQKEFNTFYEYIECIENVIIYAEQILTNYEIKLGTEGLDKYDLIFLQKECEYLESIAYFIQVNRRKAIEKKNEYMREYLFRSFYKDDIEILKNIISYLRYLAVQLGPLVYKIKKIKNSLKDNIEPISYSSFIQREVSILHLVSTLNHSNAHIRKGSDDAFYYCCTFHKERTPSMRVNNTNNTVYCYGCGMRFNAITYIMEVEDIDYYHALALLSAIYDLPFKNNPYDKEDIRVKTYRNSASIKKYKRQLLAGYEKAKTRDKTCHNLEALDKYKHDIETLDRLKRKGAKKVKTTEQNNKLILTFEK